MNTVQAEYRTDIARLAEDMAKRETEAVKRDAQKAEREASTLRWQKAAMLAGIDLAATHGIS